MTKKFVVQRDLSRGFTDSTRRYMIVDTTTNLPEEDSFTNKRLASEWASYLNRTNQS